MRCQRGLIEKMPCKKNHGERAKPLEILQERARARTQTEGRSQGISTASLKDREDSRNKTGNTQTRIETGGDTGVKGQVMEDIGGNLGLFSFLYLFFVCLF